MRHPREILPALLCRSPLRRRPRCRQEGVACVVRVRVELVPRAHVPELVPRQRTRQRHKRRHRRLQLCRLQLAAPPRVHVAQHCGFVHLTVRAHHHRVRREHPRRTHALADLPLARQQIESIREPVQHTGDRLRDQPNCAASQTRRRPCNAVVVVPGHWRLEESAYPVEDALCDGGAVVLLPVRHPLRVARPLRRRARKRPRQAADAACQAARRLCDQRTDALRHTDDAARHERVQTVRLRDPLVRLRHKVRQPLPEAADGGGRVAQEACGPRDLHQHLVAESRPVARHHAVLQYPDGQARVLHAEGDTLKRRALHTAHDVPQPPPVRVVLREVPPVFLLLPHEAHRHRDGRDHKRADVRCLVRKRCVALDDKVRRCGHVRAGCGVARRAVRSGRGKRRPVELVCEPEHLRQEAVGHLQDQRLQLHVQPAHDHDVRRHAGLQQLHEQEPRRTRRLLRLAAGTRLRRRRRLALQHDGEDRVVLGHVVDLQRACLHRQRRLAVVLLQHRPHPPQRHVRHVLLDPRHAQAHAEPLQRHTPHAVLEPRAPCGRAGGNAPPEDVVVVREGRDGHAGGGAVRHLVVHRRLLRGELNLLALRGRLRQTKGPLANVRAELLRGVELEEHDSFRKGVVQRVRHGGARRQRAARRGLHACLHKAHPVVRSVLEDEGWLRRLPEGDVDTALLLAGRRVDDAEVLESAVRRSCADEAAAAGLVALVLGLEVQAQHQVGVLLPDGEGAAVAVVDEGVRRVLQLDKVVLLVPRRRTRLRLFRPHRHRRPRAAAQHKPHGKLVLRRVVEDPPGHERHDARCRLGARVRQHLARRTQMRVEAAALRRVVCEDQRALAARGEVTDVYQTLVRRVAAARGVHEHGVDGGVPALHVRRLQRRDGQRRRPLRRQRRGHRRVRRSHVDAVLSAVDRPQRRVHRDVPPLAVVQVREAVEGACVAPHVQHRRTLQQLLHARRASAEQRLRRAVPHQGLPLRLHLASDEAPGAQPHLAVRPLLRAVHTAGVHVHVDVSTERRHLQHACAHVDVQRHRQLVRHPQQWVQMHRHCLRCRGDGGTGDRSATRRRRSLRAVAAVDVHEERECGAVSGRGGARGDVLAPVSVEQLQVAPEAAERGGPVHGCAAAAGRAEWTDLNALPPQAAVRHAAHAGVARGVRVGARDGSGHVALGAVRPVRAEHRADTLHEHVDVEVVVHGDGRAQHNRLAAGSVEDLCDVHPVEAVCAHDADGHAEQLAGAVVGSGAAAVVAAVCILVVGQAGGRAEHLMLSLRVRNRADEGVRLAGVEREVGAVAHTVHRHRLLHQRQRRHAAARDRRRDCSLRVGGNVGRRRRVDGQRHVAAGVVVEGEQRLDAQRRAACDAGALAGEGRVRGEEAGRQVHVDEGRGQVCVDRLADSLRGRGRGRDGGFAAGVGGHRHACCEGLDKALPLAGVLVVVLALRVRHGLVLCLRWRHEDGLRDVLLERRQEERRSRPRRVVDKHEGHHVDVDGRLVQPLLRRRRRRHLRRRCRHRRTRLRQRREELRDALGVAQTQAAPHLVHDHLQLLARVAAVPRYLQRRRLQDVRAVLRRRRLRGTRARRRGTRRQRRRHHDVAAPSVVAGLQHRRQDRQMHRAEIGQHKAAVQQRRIPDHGLGREAAVGDVARQHHAASVRRRARGRRRAPWVARQLAGDADAERHVELHLDVPAQRAPGSLCGRGTSVGGGRVEGVGKRGVACEHEVAAVAARRQLLHQLHQRGAEGRRRVVGGVTGQRRVACLRWRDEGEGVLAVEDDVDVDELQRDAGGNGDEGHAAIEEVQHVAVLRRHGHVGARERLQVDVDAEPVLLAVDLHDVVRAAADVQHRAVGRGVRARADGRRVALCVGKVRVRHVSNVQVAVEGDAALDGDVVRRRVRLRPVAAGKHGRVGLVRDVVAVDDQRGNEDEVRQRHVHDNRVLLQVRAAHLLQHVCTQRDGVVAAAGRRCGPTLGGVAEVAAVPVAALPPHLLQVDAAQHEAHLLPLLGLLAAVAVRYALKGQVRHLFPRGLAANHNAQHRHADLQRRVARRRGSRCGCRSRMLLLPGRAAAAATATATATATAVAGDPAWAQLTDDLHRRVFSYLDDALEVLRFALVCRSAQRAVRGVPWRWLHELEFGDDEEEEAECDGRVGGGGGGGDDDDDDSDDDTDGANGEDASNAAWRRRFVMQCTHAGTMEQPYGTYALCHFDLTNDEREVLSFRCVLVDARSYRVSGEFYRYLLPDTCTPAALKQLKLLPPTIKHAQLAEEGLRKPELFAQLHAFLASHDALTGAELDPAHTTPAPLGIRVATVGRRVGGALGVPLPFKKLSLLVADDFTGRTLAEMALRCGVLRPYLTSWCNMKDVFAACYDRRGRSIEDILRHFAIGACGSKQRKPSHRGMTSRQACRNLQELARAIATDGYPLPTTRYVRGCFPAAESGADAAAREEGEGEEVEEEEEEVEEEEEEEE
eukprot:Rhum_TRINITY_DN14549_c13_g1::Rhum_TRINITY_DN14549_c13_g1_i1::g.98814::m.98814